MPRQRRVWVFDFNAISTDRHRVDHWLYRALVFVVPEHKHELPGFVLHQFSGVDVLQNVGAVHRQQDLVYFKDGSAGLERNGLYRPVVGAHGDDTLAHQVACTVTAQTRLDLTKALGIFLDQAQPTRVKDHHIALANFYALFL